MNNEPKPKAQQTPRSKLSRAQRAPAITAKCPAHNKKGKPCGAAAGQATTHPGVGLCKWHGGMSPNGIQHAARLKLEAELAKQETYGRAVKIDPIEALLAEVHRAAGHVEWLGVLIRQQEPEALVEETPVGGQTSALLRLYQQEREMLRRACESAIKAGVVERQFKIAEEQARMVAAAVQAVFNDPEPGLTPQQRALWPSLARRHLEALPRGEEPEI